MRLHFLAQLGVLLVANLWTLSIAHSQETTSKIQALEILKQTATEMCKDIPLEGSGNNAVLTGNAKAELDNVLKKVIELDVSGAVKYEQESYKNVLHEDLANALKNSGDCKLAVLKLFHDDFFPKGESDTRSGLNRFKFLGLSLGMLAEDAQKTVPSLKLKQINGSYWLTAKSTFTGDEATYYFGLSDKQPYKINRIYVSGSRSALGENAANLRAWCSERPDQLRSEFLHILGLPPSSETGWVNEDIPSDVTSPKNLKQMCQTAFQPRPDVDDPLLQLRFQGFSKLSKQSFRVYSSGHNNEKASVTISYLLRCVTYISGYSGNTIATPCDVTCSTEFDLYF